MSAVFPTPTTQDALDQPATPLLLVRDLQVAFTTPRGVVRAVDGLDLTVHRGEVAALVGESGCGKSVTALAIMGLLRRDGRTAVSGSVRLDGVDLLTLGEEGMRQRRGRDIGMIFQEPMSSLNPVLNIGVQITEPLRIHLGMSQQRALDRATELLDMVGISDPRRRLLQYPHELSGGMRQRVMIAIALACEPGLIIADEPTTALDVTIQAQILELLKSLSQRLGVAMIFITHNLGVVARYADSVSVMYAARKVEGAPTDELFARPLHPYAHGLLSAVPRLDRPATQQLQTIEGSAPNLAAPPPGCRFAPRCSWADERCKVAPVLQVAAPGHEVACWRSGEIDLSEPFASAPRLAELRQEKAALLELDGVSKNYAVSRGQVRAVVNASLQIAPGETVGLVGESGCGKSTMGRLVTWLEKPSDGRIIFDGADVATLRGAARRDARRAIQAVFQDPFSSLNPRLTLRQTIAEPIRTYRLERGEAAIAARVEKLMSDVGLSPAMADRFPHELSGGQRQRVGIARALAMQPRLIVCDEAVSALDVSIQGQVVNLLTHLQRETGVAYLFIAHDLAVVRHIAHRIGVMYLGHIVETGDANDVMSAPLHPYTRALIEAVPIPDPKLERTLARQPLKGEVPSPLTPPRGCVFSSRCPLVSDECRQSQPSLRVVRPGSAVACFKV